MSPEDFAGALVRLGWTHARAARELGVWRGGSKRIPNRQRIGHWATGKLAVPPYIAAHIRTHLLLAEVIEATGWRWSDGV